MKLKQKHVRALRWAVREAAGWRGYWVNHPDSRVLEAFDEAVKSAKEALSIISRRSP